MSWTVVDDNGALQVRATIFDSKELEALIACLQERNKQLQQKEPTNE